MSIPLDWIRGYARQAEADFKTWEFSNLHKVSVPLCHRLLFLQMACEKICKAHLMHVQKVELKDLQRHGVVADTLKTVIEAQLRRMKKDTREVGWTLTRIKHWAEQIEILNPSIDRGGREPANCEYPWADEQGKVHSPLDHSFGALNFRKEPASATFLTLLGEAISYYAKM